ncbi:uncharacterized protein LOC112567320 [Pomacea canaliculata]|uniref:uncharacterized protein LOC112567320 n=1 Tax=Pomacea canaliculata TaxID=400727 RepID=UPI000D73CB7D|nr:uncharacterized protein LOC112567320 [Pomacea canaliculata]
MLMLFVAVACLGYLMADNSNLPFPLDCGPNASCTNDQNPWCIKGDSKPLFGHCAIQEAICNGGELDMSNACLLPYVIDCEDPYVCNPDEKAWCLEGSSEPVFGHCGLQIAICLDNAVVDFTDSCLEK